MRDALDVHAAPAATAVATAAVVEAESVLDALRRSRAALVEHAARLRAEGRRYRERCRRLEEQMGNQLCAEGKRKRE